MTVVLIIIGVVILLGVVFFVGGLVISTRRRHDPAFAEKVSEADAMLERARAQDKGWDRALMEAAARAGLLAERPDFDYDNLHLVLVDDRPGVEEDRAHLVAMGKDGSDQTRVILTRTGEGDWITERIE